MVMLDATAGNRVMWKNKNPFNIIFLDREYDLGLTPDIFADNQYLPFRKNVFTCVFYDPPYQWGKTLWSNNPKGKTEGSSNWTWYGTYNNKKELLHNLLNANKEFSRVSKRLCFKWCDLKIPIRNILSIFKTYWNIVYKKKHNSKKQTSKNQTWWVTFIREETKPKKKETPENDFDYTVGDGLEGETMLTQFMEAK